MHVLKKSKFVTMKRLAIVLGFLTATMATGIAYGQEIPATNKEIVRYVETVIGQQVDRGECWDLAYQALNRVEADWDGRFKYGKKVDPMKDKIFPGDLIQFDNIKIQYTEGNTTYTETMGQHTAIVYEVLGKGRYRIAHQNTDFSGRKVGISKLNINHIVKGDLDFYRPKK